MNELKILGTEKVGNFKFTGIEGGFGENKKAMLVKDIATIHGRPVKAINQAINMNRARFKDGIDVIDLKIESGSIKLTEFFNRQQIANSNNIYLLSERGYAKLLKILEDDKAWEIYDELVDNYFNMRYVIQKQDSYMITDPVQRAKRWIEEQEEHQVKLAMAKQETKDVQDNTPISSKDYQVLSRKIGQKLDRYLSQHQIYNKNQVALLRWDLNNAILKAAGVPARTLIKQKHFTAIAEALVNWEPSESTLEKMKAY
ncbi:ORF6N domain-containing protein [Ligilactobacillus salivarius]|uniref:ORF6N domain-containing protein n=1 Tax=Ligilactobacillus salivarius TaxID=1624 RepID=A0A921IDF1_9LACO|nr:ORF6N domain-containing protein [Ligilactobacillus salivarius]MDM8283035.1 ORF6N domain-containing protein [Ligilactobacillus salivarius]HJG15569.1 ORF6N domain-containing protein [Ligilactobacillus salivarius]